MAHAQQFQPAPELVPGISKTLISGRVQADRKPRRLDSSFCLSSVYQPRPWQWGVPFRGHRLRHSFCCWRSGCFHRKQRIGRSQAFRNGRESQAIFLETCLKPSPSTVCSHSAPGRPRVWLEPHTIRLRMGRSRADRRYLCCRSIGIGHPPGGSIVSRRILVADNDEQVRRGLQVLLSNAGYTVLFAVDGISLIEQAVHNINHIS